MLTARKIIISRTDSIGDVVLTLPVAAALKQQIHHCEVYFLGNTYTKNIIEKCEYVDVFLNYDDLKKENGLVSLKNIEATDIIHVFPNKNIASWAKKAGIKNRVATTNRLFHWNTCNKLVLLSRKNSKLHEAQLNLKLLNGLGLHSEYSLSEIACMYGLSAMPHHKKTTSEKIRLILHPKSKGSAREWGTNNFRKFITLLNPNVYDIYVSGTKEEKPFADEICSGFTYINNICGTLSLSEFINFIAESDVLIACSTGPLHIASALGIKAIGLYAPMKPIFPQRWAPVGKNAGFLVLNKKCNDCKGGGACSCIIQLTPESVFAKMNTL